MRAGFARSDISVFEPSMAMMGWGVPQNVSLSVHTPLSARAMVLDDGRRKLAYLCVDLCFISAALRQAVIERLSARGFDTHGVMITATHTHRGPSGYSHAFFYDLNGPGFSKRVFEGLCEGLCQAVEQAEDALEEAQIRLGEGRVPPAERILFNRSLNSALLNPEFSGPHGPKSAEDAVDRTMTLLRVDSLRGRPLGVLNFLALHATSMHSDATSMHPDHKGLAATLFEERARSEHGAGEGFVALFAQGCAGDVSPNYRLDPARGFTVGRYDDDEESARYVARVQVETAARIFERSESEGRPLTGPLDGLVTYADLELRPLDPAALGLQTPPSGAPLQTTRAILGLPMAAGTAEGRGPLWHARPMLAFLRELKRSLLPGQDPKLPMLALGPGISRRFLAAIDLLDPKLPLDSIPNIAHARRAARIGAGQEMAWIPTILPIQILRIGDFVIAGLPNEPTTVAGMRLKGWLLKALTPAGISSAVVQGYANAYSGYVTTAEEYSLQAYEGAYTLFGPHTLHAYGEILVDLSRELVRVDERDGLVRAPTPPLRLCSPEQLSARAWRSVRT